MSMDTTYTEQQVGRALKKRGYSRLQRYALYQFHPRSLFIGSVGLIWFTYWFWHHEWKLALSAVLVSHFCAYLSVRKIDVHLFSESILGRIAKLHLQSFNFFTQMLGTLVLLAGIWSHSTETILVGFSIVLMGHVCGWSAVHKKLRNHFYEDDFY